MDNIYNEIDRLYQIKKKKIIITSITTGIFFSCLLISAILISSISKTNDNYTVLLAILLGVGSAGFAISMFYSIKSFGIINKYKATTMIFEVVSKAEISEIVPIPQKDAIQYYKNAFSNSRYIIPYLPTFTAKIPFGTVFQGGYSVYVSNGKSGNYYPLTKGLVYIMEINNIYDFFYARSKYARLCYAKGMRKEYKNKEEMLLVPKGQTSISNINELVEKLKAKFSNNFVFRVNNKYVLLAIDSELVINYKERKTLMELQDRFNLFAKEIASLREYLEELFL